MIFLLIDFIVATSRENLSATQQPPKTLYRHPYCVNVHFPSAVAKGQYL